MYPFGARQEVLTGLWTPQDGTQVTHSDLPDPWLAGLDRLGHDLRVRHYGGDITRVDWVAVHDPDGGAVWLNSSVTVVGRKPSGLAGNGMGAQIDADEETALVSMADLLQTEVAEVGTAWPWADEGGFMNPHLVDGVAVWMDRKRASTRIGDLPDSNR